MATTRTVSQPKRQVKKSSIKMPKKPTLAEIKKKVSSPNYVRENTNSGPKRPAGSSPKKLSAAASRMSKLSGASGSASTFAAARVESRSKTTPKGWGPMDWRGNVYGQELAKLKGKKK